MDVSVLTIRTSSSDGHALGWEQCVANIDLQLDLSQAILRTSLSLEQPNTSVIFHRLELSSLKDTYQLSRSSRIVSTIEQNVVNNPFHSSRMSYAIFSKFGLSD